MNTRYIIYSNNYGVYLGNFMGIGFWSKLETGGQSKATTYDSIESAQSDIDLWKKLSPEFPECVVLKCEADKVEGCGYYASIEQCVAAGADKWEIKLSEPMPTLVHCPNQALRYMEKYLSKGSN